MLYKSSVLHDLPKNLEVTSQSRVTTAMGLFTKVLSHALSDSMSQMTHWSSGTMSCHGDSLLPFGHPPKLFLIGMDGVCGTYCYARTRTHTHTHTHTPLMNDISFLTPSDEILGTGRVRRKQIVGFYVWFCQYLILRP